MRDAVKIGHMPGLIQPEERLVGIALFVHVQEFAGAGKAFGPEVNGFEDAAIDRQEVRREAQFTLFEAGDLKHLRHVAVAQHGIGGEVLRHLAEAVLEGRLAPGAADAGLGVADNAGRALHHPGIDEGPYGQVGGCGIAARIGH